MNTNQQIVNAALQAYLEVIHKRSQRLNERIAQEWSGQEHIAKEHAETLTAKIKEVLGFEVDVIYPKPSIDPPTLMNDYWTIYQADYKLDDYFQLNIHDGMLYVYHPGWFGNGVPINSLEDLGSVLVRYTKYQNEWKK